MRLTPGLCHRLNLVLSVGIRMPWNVFHQTVAILGPPSSPDEEIISIKRRDVWPHICYFFVKYLRYCVVSIIISEVCHGMLTSHYLAHHQTQTHNRWILWCLPRWCIALHRLFLACNIMYSNWSSMLQNCILIVIKRIIIFHSLPVVPFYSSVCTIIPFDPHYRAPQIWSHNLIFLWQPLPTTHSISRKINVT